MSRLSSYLTAIKGPGRDFPQFYPLDPQGNGSGEKDKESPELFKHFEITLENNLASTMVNSDKSMR